MACIINASTSAGLVQSADTSGILQLQSNGTTIATVSSTGLSASGTAKAWVNFNGSAATVTNAFNVSSVTRNSAGQYTINFTNAMPNANYVMSGSASQSAGVFYLFGGLPVSTTQAAAYSYQSGVGFADVVVMQVAVNGN
jgi:hypothetical protein